ncbi:MAG TPA: cytochrome c oxidase subunit 4 [Acidimicrobiales bacterium]
MAPGEVAAAGVVPEDVTPGDQGSAPNVKAEHGGPRVPDRTVAWRIFAGIGAFVVFLAILYWFASYEDAGSVLLLLAAVLSLWFGAYLWLQQRRPDRAADASQVDEPAGAGVSEALYLPHASVWPLVIGVGAASVANGLVLGTWVIVPGLAALALGIGGFVRQSRRRD